MATTCEILFLITKLIIFPIYILYYKQKNLIINPFVHFGPPCTKRDIENPNQYLSIINFRGDHAIKTSTQHPYIHSAIPKCLCKRGTTNINIITKEQKMSSTVLFLETLLFLVRYSFLSELATTFVKNSSIQRELA